MEHAGSVLTPAKNMTLYGVAKKEGETLELQFSLTKVDKDIITSEPDIQDPRVIAMNITVQGFKLRRVNVYSPTNTDGTISQKDDFYRKIRKACNKLIIAGDFNAITSIVLTNSFYDGTGVVEDTQCNDNGARLKSFCRSKRLCMLQTYFNSPLSKRYTW